MTTENELIYDILEIVRGHQIVDDLEIDRRQVSFHLDTQRALWIRNEYNKPGRTIDHNLIQDLGCIELTRVDPAECCSVETTCKVLRTVNTIPNTVELHKGTAITRVGPVDKTSIAYSFVPHSRATFSGSGKYSSGIIQAFLLNNYLYLLTTAPEDKLLKYINVRGVFERPSEAEKFNDCDGNKCYSRDDKYPINLWMYAYLKEQVLRELGIDPNAGKDNTNDGEESFEV